MPTQRQQESLEFIRISPNAIASGGLCDQNAAVEPDDKRHPIADRIELLMAELGFENQIAMASAVGIGNDTLSNWKSGQEIGPGSMGRMASKRGVTVTQLRAFFDDGISLPPMLDRAEPSNPAPVPVATQHHPCPSLTRFMDHCYQRKEVVADALMTAMDDYVDRYGGTEMMGETKERHR